MADRNRERSLGTSSHEEERKQGATSGSREESMQESGEEKGTMRGSSSGTTGLGGERNRSSTGAPGGVEGMEDPSNPRPDEDRSRHR
jgi:hypothetical protein